MKILIELPSWLGDTVMTTPAIENIVNYYDDSQVTLIGSSISVEALKHHPKVKKTYILKKNFFSLYKIAKNLGEFDAYFSFRSSFRARFLKLLIQSNNKYQLESEKNNHFHHVEKYNHFINNCLNTNFSAGKLSINGDLELKVNKLNLIVGINPGASYGNAKRWYPEEFAKVASELSKKYEIVIFGGPNEKNIAADIEKSLIDKGVSNYQNLAGQTSISELISHIANLDLFITGDSGPMHLAASFKVPTVAIFGPTEDRVTSQWMNDKSIIIKKNLDCQPCMKRTCPLKHHNCMSLIKAADVLEAVESF